MLDQLTIFVTSATAVILEATPFLLLGSFIGALLEVFVSPATMARFIPRSLAGKVLMGVFGGMVLPTCECGVVPVARRMLLKGVPPSTTIPFMLAAPVINPVVIASTLFAFQGNWEVAYLRCLLVLIPAAGLGVALRDSSASDVLRHVPVKLEPFAGSNGGTPPSEHEGCGCGCGHAHEGKVKRVLFHMVAEFVSMARFLALGAVVSSGFKAFLPPEVLHFFSGSPFLAIGGLMILAVLLSICSEADAFVASSFATFPLMSKVAFMSIGPMVDLKLIPLFLMVFKRPVALALVVVPVVSVYVMAVLLAYMGG